MTPKALEISASLCRTTKCDNTFDNHLHLSDISGTLNSLRSGLESSQSKMELVASIEMPTTWVSEVGHRLTRKEGDELN